MIWFEYYKYNYSHDNHLSIIYYGDEISIITFIFFQNRNGYGLDTKTYSDFQKVLFYET